MSRSQSAAERGVSFSWRRAIGLSQLSARISRKTGIPLSRSGRQQKIGRLALHLILWLALAVLVLGATLMFGRPELLGEILAQLAR